MTSFTSTIPPTHASDNNNDHLASCRPIEECYEKLNKIDEGTYGIVYRARDLHTSETVAIKQLKLEKERNGFPITSLREIHTLLLAKHPNIIDVREIVVGRTLNSIYMVMEYMDYDLRGLMEDMGEQRFGVSEVKSLMLQLCRAIHHLHSSWIIHRDLKASNLLLAGGGHLKVADFGLARKYGSPLLSQLTGMVVTLWYRAPELLLGERHYTAAVDMWSVGCIFAELCLHTPLWPGRGEIDQLSRIFGALGVPTEHTWPGYEKLPNAKMFSFKPKSTTGADTLGIRLKPMMTEEGYDLLCGLLTLDPTQRLTAEQALTHPYFEEPPLPKDPSLFTTYPTKTK